MKTRYITYLTLLIGLLFGAKLHAQIFVANTGSNNGNSIGEFNLDGTPVGSGTLVTGLDEPTGLAISGTDIFVVNFGNDTLSEYTTSGAQVGPGPLVSSGMSDPTAITIMGSDLFVTQNGDAVYEYTTSGSFVESFATNTTNISGIAFSGTDMFITGANNGVISEYNVGGGLLNTWSDLNRPTGIAVSGSDVFVANNGNNTIAEYTTAGALVGSGTLISGLDLPNDIAVSGSDLYITGGESGSNSAIYEYDTSGLAVGSGTLVATDLHGPDGIAVVPEPSTWEMLAAGSVGLFAFLRFRPKRS